MSSVERRSTPIMSRQDVAQALMRIAGGIMKRMGRVYRPFVTPNARKIPGTYYTFLVSQLPDRRGNLVGEVRVRVMVPMDQRLPISVLVEWTRDFFGFWYQEEIRLENSEDPTKVFMNQFVKVMSWVKTTADGTVRLVSMNRLHRRVRKNPVKDKAARAGLSIG